LPRSDCRQRPPVHPINRVAAFDRNRWPLSIGLRGRLPSESVAALPRIPHSCTEAGRGPTTVPTFEQGLQAVDHIAGSLFRLATSTSASGPAHRDSFRATGRPAATLGDVSLNIPTEYLTADLGVPTWTHIEKLFLHQASQSLGFQFARSEDFSLPGVHPRAGPAWLGVGALERARACRARAPQIAPDLYGDNRRFVKHRRVTRRHCALGSYSRR
jgi:hypothetical protein